MLTRASARASGAPGQVCDAAPEREVLAGVGPVDVERRRVVEPARVAVRGARSAPSPSCPAGRSTPPTVVGTRESRKSPLTGLSIRSVSSMKLGMRLALVAQQLLELGVLGDQLAAPSSSSRTVVSCPAAKRLAATRTTSMTSGVEPSGNVAVASPVRTSSRGFAPAVLDVRGELLVEVLQRTVGHRVVARAADRRRRSRTVQERLGELGVVVLGHAEQVGDDEQGERARELADELALAVGEERVELAVGEPPHELLVLLEALRRDQPHQQRAVVGVHGRVERGDLVAHRQLVAVLLDELADVVALERDGEPGERTGHRGARRERARCRCRPRPPRRTR